MSLHLRTTMTKGDLVNRIKENRARHEKLYGEAVEAFWEKAQKFVRNLEERIERRDSKLLNKVGGDGRNPFRGGFPPVEMILGFLGVGDGGLPAPPPCYLDDYDQALDMVESNVGNEIELDASDFARLVRDEWDWRSQFDASYMGLTS